MGKNWGDTQDVEYFSGVSGIIAQENLFHLKRFVALFSS